MQYQERKLKAHTHATVISLDANSIILELELTGQTIQWPRNNFAADIQLGQKLLLALSALPAEMIQNFVQQAQNNQSAADKESLMLETLEALIN